MNNKKFLAGMFSIVLAFGIMVIGCNNGTTSKTNLDLVDVSGSWEFKTNDPVIGNGTLDIHHELPQWWTTFATGSIKGTYERNGNTATIKDNISSYPDSITLGTATIISSTKILVTFDKDYGAPIPTITLHKVK